MTAMVPTALPAEEEAAVAARVVPYLSAPIFSHEEFRQHPVEHTLKLLLEMSKLAVPVRMAVHLNVLQLLPCEINSLIQLGDLFRTAKRRHEALFFDLMALEILTDQTGRLQPPVPLVAAGSSPLMALLLVKAAVADSLAALKLPQLALPHYQSLRDVATKPDIQLLFNLKLVNTLLGNSASAPAAVALFRSLPPQSNVADYLVTSVKVSLHERDFLSAIEVALQLHLTEPSSPEFRGLFATVVRESDGATALLAYLQALPSKERVRLLGFLSISVRDEGCIQLAGSLLRTARALQPQSPTFTLTLVHLLELSFQYELALATARDFLQVAPDLQVGELRAATVARVLSQDPTTLDLVPPAAGDPHLAYSAAELELLALYFTLCKILYLTGQFSRLTLLGKQLQPLRLERNLHLTTTRNEHAYFACLWELFELLPVIPQQLALETAIYVVGDSHVLPLAWHQWRGRLFYPKLTTGCKIWHLRKSSHFYPKHNFLNAIESIPAGAAVLMVIGEIDCRDGFPVSVSRGRYDNIPQACAFTIKIYLKLLRQLVEQRGFRIYIHPVSPALDPTRSIVAIFNQLLADSIRRLSLTHSVYWLDFHSELLTDDQQHLRPECYLDGTHLHPNYLPCLDRALDRMWVEPSSPTSTS
jgi:tetratricopeptide (TPR) repeat protein